MQKNRPESNYPPYLCALPEVMGVLDIIIYAIPITERHLIYGIIYLNKTFIDPVFAVSASVRPFVHRLIEMWNFYLNLSICIFFIVVTLIFLLRVPFEMNDKN